jgi:WD40 repeat protein
MSTDSHSSRVIADTIVDRENPWPGLRAYNERGKDYFKGRREVARDLLRLIVREDLVLLYGISGLGKTSLLKAGVFPDLPANFLPVYLRLNFVSAETQDARNGRRPLTSSDLAAQVVAATQRSARQRNVESPSRPPVPGRGLWEYFRRADDGFWGPGGLLMTPVLVFDQFEEFFTRGESPNAAQRHFEEFLHDLANLESGREPPWYESACATDENMERPAYTRQPGVCKVVLSFREDYLANVKGLSRIIPSIDRIFLRLEPMTRKAAARAICEGGRHLIEGNGNKQTLRTSIRIIRKVTGAPGRLAETATVDPALLSLFCRELNEKRKATPGALIDRALVDSAEASQILASFYAKAMRDVHPVTRKFVEDTLVLPGTRSRWPAAEPMALAAGVPAADLDKLTRNRILRRDIAAGVARFELTHDVLVDVVLESRAHRLDQEKLAQERATLEARTEEARRAIAHAERQRKRAVRYGLTAGVAVLLLLITVLALVGIVRLEHEQRARTWADAAYTEVPRNARLSTVLGLRALNESESARVPMPLALMALNNAVRVPHLQRRIALKHTPQTIAVSADGANVALLAGTRLIELWKAPAFASPLARLNLTDDVFSITFDRDGSELVIVYRSTAVDRVELKSGEGRLEHLAPAISANRIVIAAAVSPDGKRLLLTSNDPVSGLQGLSIFDRDAASWRPPIVAPKKTSFILGGHATAYATLSSDGVLSFAPASGGRASLNLGTTTLVGLDADGSRLFAVRPEADLLTLRVVSLTTGALWSGTLPSAAAAVDGMFRGDRLALRQVDRRVSVWDLAQGRQLFEVPDAPNVVLSDDADRLLTWSTGDSIDMWDARTGRAIERVGSHDDPVSGAAIAGRGGPLMTIAGQGLYLWNRPQVDRVLSNGQTPMTATFSADGGKLLAASGQSVQLYDAHSGAPISSIAAPAAITALALAPDDKHIAIGTAQGEILVRTLQDAPGSAVKLSGGGPITALAFGASERQLAWAAQSPQQTTTVVLRNLATNEDVVSQQIAGVVVALAVDDRRVAIGLHEPPHSYLTAEPNNGAADLHTVIQLVASTGSRPVAAANSMAARPAPPKALPPPGGPPAETDSPPPPPSLTESPPPLLTSSPFGAAFAPGEPQSVAALRCGNGSASLSSNLGFGAAVTSCEKIVSQWRNLLPALPLIVERPVARVAVSPDGNYLALAYVDGGITLHHTSLPSRPATLAGPGDEITALTFDTQAARLAAARADGSVAIYPVSGPELRKAAEQLAGTLQPSAGECQRLFGASDQCEDIGAWRLVTQRIFQALTGR